MHKYSYYFRMDFTPSWQIPCYFFNRVELNKHEKKMKKMYWFVPLMKETFWMQIKLNNFLICNVERIFSISHWFFSSVGRYHLLNSSRLEELYSYNDAAVHFTFFIIEQDNFWRSNFMLNSTYTYLNFHGLIVSEICTYLGILVCTLGVSPSLVSRYCEGYSFWSIWGP